MFSGIVATTLPYLGEQDSKHRFSTASWPVRIEVGSSIAVNGVCLTAVEVQPEYFAVEIVSETFSRSNLGDLVPGDLVNVEQSISLGTLLDGNLVQGHVDSTAEVLAEPPSLRLSLPASFESLVVEKGAVTINGVALTVSALGEAYFEVALIPETLRRTNLGTLKVGSRVNVEFDLIGKYLARMIDLRSRAFG